MEQQISPFHARVRQIRVVDRQLPVVGHCHANRGLRHPETVFLLRRRKKAHVAYAHGGLHQ